jgi:hypothetical protein
MGSPRVGLLVAAVVFGLVCLAQVGRLVWRPEILVAGHVMPLWPSVAAVVIAGSLAWWLWRLSARA